jgi:hypothetical protein
MLGVHEQLEGLVWLPIDPSTDSWTFVVAIAFIAIGVAGLKTEVP